MQNMASQQRQPHTTFLAIQRDLEHKMLHNTFQQIFNLDCTLSPGINTTIAQAFNTINTRHPAEQAQEYQEKQRLTWDDERST